MSNLASDSLCHHLQSQNVNTSNLPSSSLDDQERELANDLLDDDEILFEDKKMELKSLVKQEMIKREIEQY